MPNTISLFRRNRTGAPEARARIQVDHSKENHRETSPNPFPYTSVKVLLMAWKEDELEGAIWMDLNELRDVLARDYGATPTLFRISSLEPNKSS